MFEIRISEELVLKQIDSSQAECIFSLVEENRESLREWLPWLDHSRSPDDSRKFVEASLKKQKDNGAFDAGIFYREDLVGLVGFHPIDWRNKIVNIGYWLGSKHRGKGIVAKAVRAMVLHAFQELKLNRVEIRCALGNTRSQAIPRRLGFHEEGILREAEWLYDHYVDHVIFSMLASEKNRMKSTL